MRIAVVEFAGKGGLIHYAYQLCRAMQSEGAEVTLITDRNYELDSLPHEFNLEKRLRLWDPKPDRDTVPPLFRRARRISRAAAYYREWARLLGLLKSMRPDVVQFGDVRFATDYFPISRSRKSARLVADVCHNVRPFAGGEGSDGKFGSSSREQRLYRRVYDTFDTIFVHYQSNVREFERAFPSSAAKVVPIVHGNEEIFFELASSDISPDSLRRDLGIEAHQRVILFFGTLSGYKGLDLLLDVFAAIAPKVPDAVLVVAGFPFPDFNVDDYRSRAAESGVGDRVRIFPKYVDSSAVAAWMKLADVIVFPYRDVFQSGALHVAQTFGVPIVTSSVGAMGEVIRNGATGLVVPPGDRDALASAIVRLLTDRTFARLAGEAAAHDAVTRFGWPSVARTILATYDEKLWGRR